VRRDDWLTHQLPVGMAEDDFLFRFVSIFQTIADTMVLQIDTLPHMVDATVAPTPMVRAMAEWIGVNWVDSSLEHRAQRAIVLEYAQILQWRGTKRGLRRLLRLLSDGGEVEVRDSGGIFPEGEAPNAPPHIRLDMESAGWSSISDLVRIIRQEIPATATFDLWVGGEHVWPTPESRVARTGQLPAAAAVGSRPAPSSASTTATPPLVIPPLAEENGA
jgi:phage tail-like protein